MFRVRIGASWLVLDRAALYRAGGIPLVEQDLDLLLEPPGRDEATNQAETLVFSG